jgi:hypothetical protein
MSRPALAVLAIASLLLSPPRPARAESAADRDEARALFREGSRFAKEGRWREAEERYGRSLARKRAAITLYSLGVAERRTGRLVEAIAHLRAFLAEPSAPTTALYEEPAREAIVELSRQVSRIVLTVAPAGVRGLSLAVDGVPVPGMSVGEPWPVNPGVHAVTARASGHREQRVQVTVFEGGVKRVELVLVPRAPEAPGAQSRAVPVALAVSGGIAAVAGVALGLVGVKEAGSAPTSDGPEAHHARSKALAGDLVAGSGVVTAAAGVVLLLTRRGAASPKAAVAPWISPRGAGLHLVF